MYTTLYEKLNLSKKPYDAKYKTGENLQEVLAILTMGMLSKNYPQAYVYENTDHFHISGDVAFISQELKTYLVRLNGASIFNRTAHDGANEIHIVFGDTSIWFKCSHVSLEQMDQIRVALTIVMEFTDKLDHDVLNKIVRILNEKGAK